MRTFRLYMISAVWLMANVTFGQSWQPLVLNSGQLYMSESTIATPEPMVSFRSGELLPMEISRIEENLTDTLLWPLTMNGCDIRDKNSSCFQEGHSGTCSDTFSWAGFPLIKNAAGWRFVNHRDDTIRFLNGLPQFDTILIQNDTAYMIHKVSVEEATLFGIQDSIITYTISAYVDSIALASNKWQNDTLTLSKSYGFVRMPSWYLFPGYEAWFNLSEYNLHTDISFNGVYSYQVGDIMHQELEWVDGGQGGDSYKKKELRQCVVSEIEEGEFNRFKLDCVVEKTITQYLSKGDGSLPDTTWTTVSQSDYWLAHSSSSIYGNWDSEALYYFEPVNIKKSTALSNSVDSLLVHWEDFDHGDYSDSICPLVQSVFEGRFGSQMTILAGIGEKNNSKWEFSGFPVTWYQTRSRKLLYYKGQNAEYGKPSAPIGIDEINEHDIMVSPNPTTGLLRIHTTGIIGRVELYNLSGQRLRENSWIIDETGQIDLGTLSMGVYFISIITDQGEYSEKIVKQD
ncbi:MAG: T9SS type A sorting domain-containing protein [Flavobacteriales bacterium]